MNCQYVSVFVVKIGFNVVFEGVFKNFQSNENSVPVNTSGRPRTSEDFYLFCTYVLEYEKYDAQENGETHSIPSNPSPPPLDSSGSSVNSESTSSSQEDKQSGDDSDEGDSLDLVTCYCGKPFARRPMIECSRCLTWIHLSCARIKKTQIPEV